MGTTIIRVNIHAWALSEEMRSIIQEGLSDRKLSKASIEIEMGGLDAALRQYENSQTPAIILLETDDVGDELLMRLETLAEVCDPGTSVIIMGSSNDIELYRDLVRRGISEYVVKPPAPRRIFEAVAEICMDPDATPTGRLIAFIGRYFNRRRDELTGHVYLVHTRHIVNRTAIVFDGRARGQKECDACRNDSHAPNEGKCGHVGSRFHCTMYPIGPLRAVVTSPESC